MIPLYFLNKIKLILLKNLSWHNSCIVIKYNRTRQECLAMKFRTKGFSLIELIIVIAING